MPRGRRKGGGAKQWRIATYARVRPHKVRDGRYTLHAIPAAGGRQETLQVAIPAHLSHLAPSSASRCNFPFRGVLGPGCTQAEAYDIVASDVVEGAVEGISGCVFAYGQTGSGKTYTMTGDGSYETRGMIPRALFDIFRKVDSTRLIRVSFMEIYKERCHDLLDPENKNLPRENWSRISLLEDGQGGLLMRGLTLHDVVAEEDALRLLFQGTARRAKASTMANAESSRSHAIFTVIFVEKGGVTSRVSFVDLAGSERMWKHEAGQAGDFVGPVSPESRRAKELRQKEGLSINLSLHSLEKVVLALRDRSAGHIPYRTSALTTALRECLGGNCRTAFVMTLAPEESCIEETLSTCRFSQRCSAVTWFVGLDSDAGDADAAAELEWLRQERKVTKAKLAAKDRELAAKEQELKLLLKATKGVPMDDTSIERIASGLVRGSPEAQKKLAQMDLRSSRTCARLLATRLRNIGEAMERVGLELLHLETDGHEKLANLLDLLDRSPCPSPVISPRPHPTLSKFF